MGLSLDRDMAVAQAAIDLRFITPAQLDECLGIQKNMSAMGVNDELASILIKKGYLTAQQLIVITQAFESEPPVKAAPPVSEPARPPKPPAVPLPSIKGFEVLSVLGKGGMGTVYWAKQLSIDRFVALKVLKPELSKEPEYVERFVREAKAVARLNQKNIVMAYDVGESNGNYYMAMEYVDGRSLFRIIKEKGMLDEHDVVKIAIELCQALAYIHENRMIHRDIKPENILITLNGSPKLLDLGLARVLQSNDSSITMAGTAMGTPNYISPEQITGQRDLDIRCDIYALGGTLFAMLTGKPPYTGESPAVVFAKHLHDPIPDPRKANPSVSVGLAKIIVKCLAKDREERYSSPRQVMADLEGLSKIEVATPVPKAVRPAPVPRPAASAPPRLVVPETKSNTPLIFGILAIVVVGIGVVIFMTSGRTSSPPGPIRPDRDPSPHVNVPVKPDPLREVQAEKYWTDAQQFMSAKKWVDALRALAHLTGELSSSQFMSAHKPEVDKAVEDCNAALAERRNAADALEKKARDALSAKKWAESADAYTKLVNEFADIRAEQLDSYRDALAICDRESKVESLLKEVQEAIKAENWEVARDALQQVTRGYANSLTVNSRQAEVAGWEKSIREELGAIAAFDALNRQIGEKNWPEAKKTLGELTKTYSATLTVKKRKPEIDAAQAKIDAGMVGEVEKQALAALKTADDAFKDKKWSQARDGYRQVRDTYATVPAIQSQLPQIAKKIQDCDAQLQLVVEQSAIAVYAMANSYYKRQEWDSALTWYEKLSNDYKDTKAYKDRQSDIVKKMADCIAKKGK